MLTRQKINNESIKILPTQSDKKKWKGKNCFPIQHFVMSILAKRKSGKTTLIYNIIDKCASKNTIVMFFCPTFWKDKTYKSIRDVLDKRGIVYNGETNFIDDDGINLVAEFMKLEEEKQEIPEEDSDDEKDEVDVTEINRVYSLYEPAKKKKRKKKKPEPPEYLFVFDDLSSELRNKSIVKLCKNSRHYRAKIILSSQSVTDILPSVHAQTDYVVIYKSMNDDALKHLYEKIEPWISPESFKKLYYDVTTAPYHFLFIDRDSEEFRENLDKKIIL